MLRIEQRIDRFAAALRGAPVPVGLLVGGVLVHISGCKLRWNRAARGVPGGRPGWSKATSRAREGTDGGEKKVPVKKLSTPVK